MKEIIYNSENIISNDFNLDIKKIKKGIIFFYSDWSPTENILKLLIKLLPPNLTLYVYDIEHPDFKNLLYENKLKTHGMGETFWINNGKIISKILKHDSDSIHLITHNNNALLDFESLEK